MGKTIVNNNIKLKSGGGIVNDATDGLSVETGTTANKLVRLDSSAKLPAVDGSQLTNLEYSPSFESIVSANLRTSADTARVLTTSTYTKVKEIVFNDNPGTIRVDFCLRTPNGQFDAIGRIYKNGVAFGTERTTGSSTVQTYSENLSFARGDLIQLYIKNSSTGNVEASNFRLYYDTRPKMITNTVNLN